MIGKIHLIDNVKIFACCDKEILNKTLSFKDVDIHISSSFYGKEKITLKEFFNNIESCDQINIFGNKICSILLDKKIILKEQIVVIDNISHVQLYKL